MKNRKFSQNKKVSVSVVIVTYNSLPEIGACLQALRAALHSFVSQVIVIDNNSDDGTAAYLAEQTGAFRSFFNDFTALLNNENVGFTRAVNQGLAICRNDYILLMNPDVVVQDDTIATLLLWLMRHTQVGVVAPQLCYEDGKVQPSCRRFPRKVDIFLELLPVRFSRFLHIKTWKMPEFDHAHTRQVDQPQGAFLLIRSPVLQRTGCWDERFFMFFSDVDWCRRVYEHGWHIWFVADTLAYHKKGASVYRARPAMLVSSHRSFIQYFTKYDRSLLQRIGTNFVYFILLVALFLRLLGHQLTTEQEI
ncbi:glycosyltransferase family 2 protein [candidate division KSB1 bacterium]|nr:glycosyltransferase family 2 protein [candidate division KSB1 bacterium]